MTPAAPRRRRAPIPLTLLTGFLGAGKTTLLNRLLRDRAFAGTAVIVNEFGEIGLDHLLVESAADGIVELSAGCVCCTIRGELVEALERLLRSIDNGRIGAIRRVVIETTGLAEPGPILQILVRHPYLRLRFRLDGIVTVVDAVHGRATLAAHDEAADQIAVADRIVLTKTDLAGEDGRDLRLALARLNPGAPILDAAKGEAVGGALIACGPFDADAKSDMVRGWLGADAAFDDDHDHDADDHHHHPVASRHDRHIAGFALVRAAEMGETALGAFIDRLAQAYGGRLVRVKGLVGIVGGGPAVVHGVQGSYSPPVRLPAWPDEDRRSRLVVIGREVDREEIERLFDGFLGEPRPDTPDRAALMDNPLAIPGFNRRD